MKKIGIALLCFLLLGALFAGGITVAAQETSIEVSGADILRGARSNVNRDGTAVNITDEGVIVRGLFESTKPVVKVAIKKGTEFTEDFSVQTNILNADDGCTMDIGVIYGDVDESWMDPWDFLGIDMNDPGSVGKFEDIGGFTVRFSLSGQSVSTAMMKGAGTDRERAAFAVAGVTQALAFQQNREVRFVKEEGNWKILSGETVLPLEANATLLNPSGSADAQEFVNSTLDAMLGKQVYICIVMEGADGTDAAVRVESVGGVPLCASRTEDALLGDVSYNPDPQQKIEFSLAENYYMGLPEYSDRTFTYLSQAYQNPSYGVTERGLYLGGRDKLYGVNADLTYLTPFEEFDGFSAVLATGDMPKTTSAVNSSISFTMNGQKFASYYAWNSVHIRITFPYGNARELLVSMLLWGEPVSGVNVLRAETPAAYVQAGDGGEIVIKVAKTGDNYYVYVNGVRFGDGIEDVLNDTVRRIEEGYTDAAGTNRGFYVSTLNTTAYTATGLGVEDALIENTPCHYLKQIGGAKIVNERPTLKTAQAPYAPDAGDVTSDSIRLSFSSETPDRTDSNMTIDGYLVERYIGETLDTSFFLNGKDTRTFEDTGLRSDTRYIYRVYAVQGAGSESAIRLVAYQPVAVRTLAASQPAAMGGILFVAGGVGLAALLIAAIAVVIKFTKRTRIAVCSHSVCAAQKTGVSDRGRAGIRVICTALSCCIALAALGGCAKTGDSGEPGTPPPSGGDTDNPTDPPVQTEQIMIDTFENMTTPAWESGLMYNETVLMLKEGEGAAEGKLAFVPKKVLSVRNYSLTVTYRENVDYIVESDGTIRLTENSECPWLYKENLTYATRPQGVEGLYEFPSASSAIPNLMYTETSFLVEKQLCVTYEYDKEDFSREAVSSADADKLPRLRAALQEGETLRMAVLGDSISEGANSSGKLNMAPWQPTYSSLFRQYLEKRFGTDVLFENFSLGGMASAWGAQRAYAVGQFMPDVVILSFGANDGGKGQNNSVTPVSVEEFTKNICEAMENVRKYNPNCEFILVSSLMPNPQCGAFGIQGEYAAAMKGIAENDDSVVAVDMYSLHEYMIEDCGKHYVDLSSNNINHPNDFLIRLYTMNIISALWD